MKKKICLFDWGGVIETSHIEYNTIRDCLYSLGYYNIHSTSVWDEFHLGPSFSQFDIITDEKEFDEVLRKYLHKFSDKVTDEDIINYKKLYKENMKYNPYYKEVSEYIYSLKNRCEIGILSNVNLLDKERQNDHINYERLDYRFLSFELGMIKPNRNIYEYVNNVLKDYDILYLDDNPVNLDIPRELGWNVYQVQPGGDITGIKKACEEFLEKK